MKTPLLLCLALALVLGASCERPSGISALPRSMGRILKQIKPQQGSGGDCDLDDLSSVLTFKKKGKVFYIYTLTVSNGCNRPVVGGSIPFDTPRLGQFSGIIGEQFPKWTNDGRCEGNPQLLTNPPQIINNAEGPPGKCSTSPLIPANGYVKFDLYTTAAMPSFCIVSARFSMSTGIKLKSGRKCSKLKNIS